MTPSSIVNEAFMEIFIWTNEFIFPEVKRDQSFKYKNMLIMN